MSEKAASPKPVTSKESRKRYICHNEQPVKPRSRYDTSNYIAFKGFDKLKGIEITWHQFQASGLSVVEKEELLLEVSY